MGSNLVKAALGEMPADVVLKNGNLVNVNTAEVERSVDVAVKDGRVALVGDAKHCVGDTTRVVDIRGEFIVPGLLDAHIHIESSMLTLTQFARAVLPRGTTGVFIDPHEIVNVLGLKGMEILMEEGKRLPLKVFFEVPSCVPSAPSLETNGAELGPREVASAMKFGNVVGLAEMMNVPGVLSGDETVSRKLEIAKGFGRVIEGHAPGMGGKELAAYISAGIHSDHESSVGKEAVEKLRRGMKLEIREGSAARNLSALMKDIVKLVYDTRHCLLATDDKHPGDLLKEGHIDHAIRLAIKEGVEPVEAIQMATLNTAEHFGILELGSISPGKVADIVIVKDLEKFTAGRVFASGKLVADKGRMIAKLQGFAYPDFTKATINLKKKPVAKDFTVKAGSGSKTKSKVICVMDGEITTEMEILKLKSKNGEFLPDVSKDVIRAAVVERHRRTGNVGLGFVRGFGLNKGALASSVGHDSHNITVLGVEKEEMAVAVDEIQKSGGGQVVVLNGKAIAKVELPIAGLLSEKPAEDVAREVDALNLAARRLGTKLKSPFMTMAFLSLPVIPKLRLTDKGLVDVEKFSIVNLLD